MNRTHRQRVYDQFTNEPDRPLGARNPLPASGEPDNMVEVARHPADCKITRDDETNEWVIYGSAPEPESEDGDPNLNFNSDDRRARRVSDRRPRTLRDLNALHRRRYATPAQRAIDNSEVEVELHNHLPRR